MMGYLTARSLTASLLSLLMLTTVSLGQTRPDQTTKIPTHATVEHDPRFEAVRGEIMLRVADDIPSFAVAVAHEGKILWEEAFGWADKETKTEATPYTIYPLASLSKSVTATGIMVLQEQGRIRLDESIDNYVEENILTPLAGSLSEITIRDLLTMTGGFPQGWKGLNTPNPPQSTRELLKHHGGLVVFPPGKFYHYSNFSPAVAELVVEGATGQTFGDFMRAEVFEPVGMEQTQYALYAKQRDGVLATRYLGSGRRVPKHTPLPAGGAGAESTIADLIRYGLFHLNQPLPGQRQILSAAALEEMHFGVTALSGNRHALGWFVSDLGNDLKLLVSDGHGRGSVSLLYLLPSKNIAVACLMNTRKQESDWFNGQFTDKVAAEVVDRLVEGFKARISDRNAKRQTVDNTYKTTPALLGAWEGTLRDYTGKTVRADMLFQEDGDIHITLRPQFTVLVQSAQMQDGLLMGQFASAASTDEDYPWDHLLQLRLHFEEDEAHGYLMSIFRSEEGVFGLPSYLHLRRKR